MAGMAFYPIEMNGTGLSGTHCAVPVKRRRYLLPKNPECGYTLKTEPCMALGKWWAYSEHETNGKATYCTKHKNQIENPKPQPRPAARLARTITRYNKRIEANQAAFRGMQGDQLLARILKET